MKSHTLFDAVGKTPIVLLNKINPYSSSGINLYAKLEFMNPCGSVKDRSVAQMIINAEKQGFLNPGGTIVEETSGNTGMAVTLLGLSRGYKVVLLMPQKASIEKQNMLKAAGANVIVTEDTTDINSPKYYVNIRKRIVNETPGAYFLDQFNNMSNIDAHTMSTGPEIWRQTNGKITHWVAGAGTGGTLLGTAKYLKNMNDKVKVIMADPMNKSGYHDYWKTGSFPNDANYGFQIEGIGEDFLASIVEDNIKLVDDVVLVDDKSAFTTAIKLLKEEGIFGGGSGGANIYAALQTVYKLHKAGRVGQVVTIIPDSGRSYISKLYNPAWRQEMGYEI